MHACSIHFIHVTCRRQLTDVTSRTASEAGVVETSHVAAGVLMIDLAVVLHSSSSFICSMHNLYNPRADLASSFRRGGGKSVKRDFSVPLKVGPLN